MSKESHTISVDQDVQEWDQVISPQRGLLQLRLDEVWAYRDLLRMFIKRDIITVYKQTILGPIWYVLQPIMMTAIYTLVFGNIAGIETDGLPKILFYLAGIILWNYFQESFNTTSKTFLENAQIFGKVYFPRLIIPLSKVFSGVIKFVIQFTFFIAIFLFYKFFMGTPLPITPYLLLIPVFVLMIACFGLGLGIFFTSLTTKYRDLNFLLQFGVQLLMYASPIIYPVSTIPEKYKWFILLNPVTPIIEGFKFSLLGKGEFDPLLLTYSAVVIAFVLFIGVISFNRTERNFIDTV